MPRNIADDYDLDPTSIGSGNYGNVFKAALKKLPSRPLRAVKLLKIEHCHDPKRRDDFLTEVDCLSKLNHSNIVRIFETGLIDADQRHNVPFYVMDYHESGSLEKILESNKPLKIELLEKFARDILTGLEACHSHPQRIIHLDLKPDNILVSYEDANESKPRFIITDFGKAKLLIDEDQSAASYVTVGGGIFEFVHPILRPYLRSNRVPKGLFIKYGEWFDVYSFTEIISRIIKRLDPKTHQNHTKNWIFFLDKIRETSLNLEAEGLPKKPIRFVFEKLDAIFPELHYEAIRNSASGRTTIRLSNIRTITVSSKIQTLIDTPEFQRLRRIRQLAFTHLVYPSATHTRHSHALGAYGYCIKYIQKLCRDIQFRLNYDTKDVEALLYAALLHDIGHYSCAHYLEEMGYTDNELDFEHENLTSRIICGELSYSSYDRSSIISMFGLSQKSLLEELKAGSPSIATLLADYEIQDRIQNIFKGAGEYRLLKQVLSGPIDCDKLDYVIRDGQSSGVPYAFSVDEDRLIDSLSIDWKADGGAKLGVTSKGRSAVESLLTARFNLFTEVYWHKTCRAVSTQLKEAVFLATPNIEQDEFEAAAMGLDDSQFIFWISQKISDRDAAADLLFNSLGIGSTRLLYKRIKTLSATWTGEKEEVHTKFIDRLGHKYRDAHNYKNEVVDTLNDQLARRPGWKTIPYHALLLDIPPSSTDKVGEIAITYPEFPNSHFTLSSVSHIVRSLQGAFHKHAKKVRFYVHQNFQVQIQENMPEFERIVMEALKVRRKRK